MKLSRRAFAVGGLAAAGLAGCSKDRPRDTIRVSSGVITFSKMYEAVAAAFMKANPGLTVELIPGIENLATMQRDFRMALVNDEPDVTHVSLHQVRFYVDRGLAAPMDERIAATRATLTTSDTIGKYSGVTRALPFAVSVPVTYFNTGLFGRVGYTPDQLLAFNWEQLIEAAAKVSDLEEPISGMYWETSSDSALAWQMLVASQGGRMMSLDEKKVAFGDDKGRWAAETLAAMGRAGQRNMSRDEARMAFTAGILGTYHNTSSNITRFSEKNTGFPVTVAAMPTAPEIGRLPAAGNAVLITTRKPERQDNAWKYVEFVTGPIGQTIMAQMTGYISMNQETINDPKLLKPFLDATPQYKALYDKVSQLESWYAFPGPRSEQIGKYIMNKMNTIIYGWEQPLPALADMVSRAQRWVDMP